MEVATLPLGKSSPTPTEEEAEWVPEPGCTTDHPAHSLAHVLNMLMQLLKNGGKNENYILKEAKNGLDVQNIHNHLVLESFVCLSPIYTSADYNCTTVVLPVFTCK